MLRLSLFLFILFGDYGRYIPPTPQLTPQPGATQSAGTPAPQLIPQATANPTAGPFYIIGNPWNNTTDPGHCDGFTPYTGNGSPPSLAWPVDSRAVNLNRGFRVGHPALDIYAAEGDPVYAAASGSVVWAGWSSFGGGEVVAVSHGGGWYSVSFHLSAVFVDCWQWVGRGEVVGAVGDTGAVSAGYFHLHFYLANGIMSYDPAGRLP